MGGDDVVAAVDGEFNRNNNVPCNLTSSHFLLMSEEEWEEMYMHFINPSFLLRGWKIPGKTLVLESGQQFNPSLTTSALLIRTTVGSPFSVVVGALRA